MIQRRSPLQSLALGLTFGAIFGLTACARSATEAMAPAASAPEPALATGEAMGPADLEEQLAALGEAEAQLNQVLGGRVGRVEKQEEAKPAATPPKVNKLPADEPGVKKDKGAEPLAQGDTCGTACSALSSMERAAVHLCGLAGEGDPRCEGARTRVRSATDRVRASCPACAAR